MIERFLWKLIGADHQVLRQCPVQDRYSFSLAGSAVLLVLLVFALSLYYTAHLVFETIYSRSLAALFWSFALGNLYMLNLVTIDSSSLPQRKAGSRVPALALRILFIALLAVITAAPLELFLFGNARAGHLLEGLRHLPRAAALFSVLVVLIFLTPVYMKLFSLRTTAYSEKRKAIELQLVTEEYLGFRRAYAVLMKESTGKDIAYPERYTDAPFNLEKKKDARFINGKGKLIEFLKKEGRDPDPLL